MTFEANEMLASPLQNLQEHSKALTRRLKLWLWTKRVVILDDDLEGCAGMNALQLLLPRGSIELIAFQPLTTDEGLQRLTAVLQRMLEPTQRF